MLCLIEKARLQEREKQIKLAGINRKSAHKKARETNKENKESLTGKENCVKFAGLKDACADSCCV